MLLGAHVEGTRRHCYGWRGQRRLARTPLDLARRGGSLAGRGALGEVVEVRDGAGAVLGQGLWDPSSPIAVRLYARAATPRLDVGGIAQGIERAIERRRVAGFEPRRHQRLIASATAKGTGSRAWSSIATATSRCCASMATRSSAGLDALGASALAAAGSRAESVLWPIASPARSGGTTAAAPRGRLPAGYDHRARKRHRDGRRSRARPENRSIPRPARKPRPGARTRAGRRVLNLFSYAGGFSTAAALGGART